MQCSIKPISCDDRRGFDSRRLHHSTHSNQCLSSDALRQLWLQYPPVSLDKAALRQPRRALGRRRLPWSARPRLRIVPGSPEVRIRQAMLAEVESACAISQEGCWVYPTVRDGAYPYIDLRGSEGERLQWSARRYAWALANGDIPEDGVIMGNCALKACVRPDHQWLWVPPKQFDLLGFQSTSRGDA